MIDQRLKKIATLGSIEEIEGYRWGAKESGRTLDQMEVEELIRRQREIERATAPKGTARRQG